MERDRDLASPDGVGRPGAWRQAWSRWADSALTGDEAAAFADEAVDRDLRRLRLVAPLMVALHVAHVGFFYTPASQAAGLSELVVRWRGYAMELHAATLPLALLAVGTAYTVSPRSWQARNIMALSTAGYMVHGAVSTSIDQMTLGNVASYTGYCFGIAFLCGLSLRTALWVYSLGAAVVLTGIAHFQVDPALRTANMLNVVTVTTTALALSILLDQARRRDFRQRRTIARQRDELAGLNASLERRVNEQVEEIVRRAGQIGQLNAQLQSQVRARSQQLEAALAKLARHRIEDGSLPAGTVLGDRFEISGTLGAGAMGVVYCGRDRASDAEVAIKVIRPGSTIEGESMRRFIQEAGAVAAVSHPAVVRMIHVDITDDGLLYQAQELLEGSTLEESMQDGAWPPAEAARLGQVLCEALAAAHERGVVHRDIKPANVMLVDEAPGLKLLDFGLAKLYETTSVDSENRTGTSLVVGTPAFMAPEQVLGEAVTGKADVYSVGVLLFQLTTARAAFDVAGASRVMIRHVTSKAPDLRSRRPEVGEEMSSIVSACMARKAEERPDAADLANRLWRFADAAGTPDLVEIVRKKNAPSEPAAPTAASDRAAKPRHDKS